MRSPAKKIEGKLFVRCGGDYDDFQLWRLAQKFRHSFYWIERQCRFKNQNVRGKFGYCGLSLRQRLGLANNADIVFQRENLAQTSAKDSLGVGQDHADQLGRAAILVSTVIFADADRAGHQFPSALCSLEMVFVNHHAYAATPFVLKAADYAAMTVNLYVGRGAHNISRKQDGEVHHRTHGNVAIHSEEHAIGGDVLGFRQTCAALRFQFHGQMQRKSRSTLHFSIVLDRSLPLRFRRQLLLCRFARHGPDEPSLRTDGCPDFQEILSAQTFNELKGSVHPGIRGAKLRKAWNNGALTA